MSVQTEIDRISTAVQNAHLKVIEKGGTSEAPYLVANLESAIDTIPVGEDVTAETTEYTELLTDLEAAVEALPDAGSGGSGSVETCTVTLTSDSKNIKEYLFTAYVDGVMTPAFWMNLNEAVSEPVVVENVVCGSSFYVRDGAGTPDGATLTGDVVLLQEYSGRYLFQARDSAGECTVHLKVD